MARPDPGLSIYVHVPFCTDKCLYCDFYSVPGHSVPEEVQAAVIDQTIRQLGHFLEPLGGKNRVQTIFVGGGTPSVLSPKILARLLAALGGTPCIEWTVEANPESLDEQFLSRCGDAGVTRLSIGIQSLQDHHLRLLRRPATRKKTLAAIDLVRRRWKGPVSLDFIAGIPGQTEAEVRADLEILDELRPSHISLYQLTCEPGTALAALVHSGKITLNSPERDEDLWFAGVQSIKGRGYSHYEISNFCQPGGECRHNVRYWRMEPYLGVGPGAVSTLPAARLSSALHRPDLPEMKDTVARLTNPKDIPVFLGGVETLWGMEAETVEWRDFLLETLMMGLRLEEGIPADLFAFRFGRSFGGLFPGLWESWEARGWALPERSSLHLTEQGRLALDSLLRELAGRMSSVSPSAGHIQWP